MTTTGERTQGAAKEQFYCCRGDDTSWVRIENRCFAAKFNVRRRSNAVEYCLTIILKMHLQLNQLKRLLSSDLIVLNNFKATKTAAWVDEASEYSGVGTKRGYR